MKIKLKNIGTLKQAEIDLSKDLIVLAGPNNTGKTYAAYTVYGVCDLLRISYKYRLKDNKNVENLDSILSNVIKNPFEKTFQVTEIAEMFIDSIPEFLKENILAQLRNIFAVDVTKFEDANVTILFDKNKIIEHLINTEVLSDDILTLDKMKITKSIGESYFKYRVENKSEEQFGNFKAIIALQQFNSKAIINLYFNNLYINTAERSAINIFSKELSIKRNNIVDQLLELRDTKNGDANQLLGKLQRYPLPIRDSLVIAEDLANLSRNRSEFGFLADRIEEVLLDGKINISKDGEVQYSPNKSKVKNLSIHLTASIVKSLSNLVFYFRHLAQKGDFIIIDEPELNLHPDNQRKVARLFGEIINQGFKVMISTHSDYIIREINNLVMLKSGGEKANDLIKKYGYEEKQLIDHQRVGAYLFKNNRNSDIEVTETGFEVNTIDEEINNLNNASEDIYFTLFD